MVVVVVVEVVVVVVVVAVVIVVVVVVVVVVAAEAAVGMVVATAVVVVCGGCLVALVAMALVGGRTTRRESETLPWGSVRTCSTNTAQVLDESDSRCRTDRALAVSALGAWSVDCEERTQDKQAADGRCLRRRRCCC